MNYTDFNSLLLLHSQITAFPVGNSRKISRPEPYNNLCMLIILFRMKKSDVLGYCAIDCEMVETIDCQNALARVSIIDEQCNILLDQYVIPPGGEVVTYRTRYSGITEKIIRLHGIPFKKAQERVQSITDRYRIVGHTVKNDLETLQLIPKNPVIDIVDIEELRKKFEAVMEYDTGKEKIG